MEIPVGQTVTPWGHLRSEKQLQGFLKEIDFLDFGIETALVTSGDDHCQDLDKRNVTLLILPDISAAFDTTGVRILLSCL